MKKRAGFTLLETLVAGGILAVGTILAVGQFRADFMQGNEARSRARYTAFEQIIRRDLATKLNSFFLTSSPLCDTSVTSFLPYAYLTTSTGLQLTPVPLLGIPTFLGALPPKGNVKPQFSRVMARCARAVDTTVTKKYFQTHAGIYFCANVVVSPVANTLGPITALSEMKPVVGEFFYTNVDAGTVAGTEIACPGFAGAIGAKKAVVGALYYTFHWVSTNIGGGLYESESGVIYVGAG